MGSVTKIKEIQVAIAELEERLHTLKSELARLEVKHENSSDQEGSLVSQDQASHKVLVTKPQWPLAADEYRRYGRQMILQEIGLPGECNAASS